MANPGYFWLPCDMCGAEVEYENMHFLAELYLCDACYFRLFSSIERSCDNIGKTVLWINEDDGYCD